MTNEEKLDAVKEFLSANGIFFKENYYSRSCEVQIRLYIWDWHVGVNIGDNQKFYEAVVRKKRPVFIRDSDSKDFVIEKVQNTIIKAMVARQNKLSRKKHGNKASND